MSEKKDLEMVSYGVFIKRSAKTLFCLLSTIECLQRHILRRLYENISIKGSNEKRWGRWLPKRPCFWKNQGPTVTERSTKFNVPFSKTPIANTIGKGHSRRTIVRKSLCLKWSYMSLFYEQDIEFWRGLVDVGSVAIPTLNLGFSVFIPPRLENRAPG